MTFHPGGWLGLPSGVPDPTFDLGWWRDLLAVVAGVAGWLYGRERRALAAAAAAAFATLAVGFWVLAMGRPYGLLVDASITRWAADASVAAQAGGREAFLVGEPGLGGAWGVVARSGVSARTLLIAPTFLPLVLVPAMALVASALAVRGDAPLAAVLWLGAGTGALESLRGVGFLPGLWPRPMEGLGLLATLAFVVAAHRLLPARAATAGGATAIMVASVCAAHGPRLGLGDAALILTLDQLPWLALAVVGGGSERVPGALTLLLGGASAIMVGAAVGGDAAWFGHAAYRMGLIILAARGVSVVASRVSDHWGRVLGIGLVFATLAGSFLAWWDPFRTDAVAQRSEEPIAPALLEAMHWVRTSTPPDSVFMAAPEYAPALAVLGGRRVLRAPGLLEAPDDDRRRRTERAVLEGRPVPPLVQRYGLRYVFVAPGQFREYGLVDPGDLQGRGGLVPVYENAKGMRIYEIPRYEASEAVK